MSGAHCLHFPTCMNFSDIPRAPRCDKKDCPGVARVWRAIFEPELTEYQRGRIDGLNLAKSIGGEMRDTPAREIIHLLEKEVAETRSNVPGDTSLVSGVSAEPNEQQPHAVSQGWRDIETAPKDGTRILIWFVHAHAKYSDDPIAEGWEAAHEAHWIDHNGGGWTWHGLCGVATYWHPLPAPPSPDNAKTGGAVSDTRPTDSAEKR